MGKMVQCKTCGKEIAKSAKSCPNCGDEQQNLLSLLNILWKFSVVLIVASLIIIGALVESTNNKNQQNNTNTSTNEIIKNPTETPVQTSIDEDKKSPSVLSVPIEHTSALIKANSYANIMKMSKKSVYDQLISEFGENFSKEAAQYAIDNLNADWKANALAKAKTYQQTMAMSPAAIRNQLLSQYGENFTVEEVNYAMKNLNK